MYRYGYSSFGNFSLPLWNLNLLLRSTVRAAIYSFGTVLVVPWKQNVTLPCQSVGNPEPSVIWKQWGQIVKSSSRVSLLSEGSLQIMDLHREDSGNYTCYVKNRHGSDQITHRLTVQGGTVSFSYNICIELKTYTEKLFRRRDELEVE